MPVLPQDEPTPFLTSSDMALIEALRRGDEAAFVLLIEQYHGAMVRLATSFVGSYAVAEEVAQEAWVGVLKGLPQFEGRSSLKTWIFRILANRARTRAEREGRTIPFADLVRPDDETMEATVDAGRFHAADHPTWAGHWSSPPTSWGRLPEERLLSNETTTQIRRAMAALPPAQREVMMLRDVEGWSAEEVCTLLQISDANQRVLLHRARARVRRELEDYLSQE